MEGRQIKYYKNLINKRKSVGIKYFTDPNIFIAYSRNITDVYINTSKDNPKTYRKL